MTNPKSPPLNQNPAETEHQPAAAEHAPEPSTVKRLDPVRYGDWEIGGRCIDF